MPPSQNFGVTAKWVIFSPDGLSSELKAVKDIERPHNLTRSL